jgi:rubrerythrin
MPASIFRAGEILDMAIRIERQGIAFYSVCREVVDAPDLAETFASLIDQEHDHIEIFRQMKAGSDDERLPESFSGEYHRNTDAFVRDRVFTDPGAAADEVRRLGDARSAVDWAIAFEEKSIGFYEWIKDRVRPSESEAIDRIIAQERQHIARLQAQGEALDRRVSFTPEPTGGPR